MSLRSSISTLNIGRLSVFYAKDIMDLQVKNSSIDSRKHGRVSIFILYYSRIFTVHRITVADYTVNNMFALLLSPHVNNFLSLAYCKYK